MKKYTVYMSYSMNIPVEFSIESSKELTEDKVMEMIKKNPGKFDVSFDASMASDEEKAFWDSMDSKKEWKNIMEENLSFDDFIEDDE